MEEMVIVYITNPSRDKAEELARHLLNRRIVACVNIFECSSMYWASGFVENDGECILLVKTVEENFSAVRKIAEDMSDYQVPCVIKIPVTANQLFVQWLRSEVKI